MVMKSALSQRSRVVEIMPAKAKKKAVKKTVKKVAKKKAAKKSVTTGKQVSRYWWTYPGKRLKDPIIYEVGKRFDVVTNVRTASVDIDMGIVGIQLEGERDEIRRAVAWVEKKGVHVEPVEIGAIAS
jgi:L-aspartate semialdehyde sulfurtransferase ferredoxin